MTKINTREMGRGTKKNNKKPAAVVTQTPPKDKEELVADESETPTLEPTAPLSAADNVDAMVQEMFPDLCISCTLLERMCRHVMMCTLKSEQVPSVELMSEFRHCCRELGNCCGAPRRFEDDHGGLDGTLSDDNDQTGKFWSSRESVPRPKAPDKQ